MKKKLYIHIGLAKTGTTTIQRAITDNYDALKAIGMLSPESGVHSFVRSHDNVAWSLLSNPISYYDPDRGTYRDLVSEIHKSPYTKFLISTEAFTLINIDGIREFFKTLGDIDVKIIVYLRNPIDWIIALWTQQVKYGMESRSLLEFIQSFETTPALRAPIETVWMWSEIFGKDNMYIRIFDEVTRSPGLLKDFWATLDIEPTISDQFIEPSLQNVSLPYELTNLVRKINRRINLKRPAIQEVPLIPQYYQAIIDYGETFQNKHGKSTTLLSDEAYDLIEKYYTEGNQQIAREFLGRDELFPVHQSKDSSADPNESSLSHEDMIELLAVIGKRMLDFEVDARYRHSLQELTSQKMSTPQRDKDIIKASDAQTANKSSKINEIIAPTSTLPASLLRKNHFHESLYASPISQLSNKLVNQWRIRKNTWLVKNEKLWVPQLFNEEWYTDRHQDVEASGIHPYVHFRLFGWYQGYQPMPLFDVDWYITRYPDFNSEGMNPLEHYERRGQHQGYRPCVLFDPKWYLATYEDIKQAGIDPLHHYCYQGWREGRKPSPEFDTAAYIKKHPELAETDISTLLYHLTLNQGHEQPVPTPTNDKKRKDIVERIGENWKQSPYYTQAEEMIDVWWREGSVFYKLFSQMNPQFVCEIACGHGRHVPHYIEQAQRVILTDINEENIQVCQRRFAGDERITYMVNNGVDLDEIEDKSLTCVFCYDAMVHFDIRSVIGYVDESFRVLKPGGMALFHYSNYDQAPSNIYYGRNPHARNFMSEAIFRHIAISSGLEVVESHLINWGKEKNLDGVTLLKKPNT